MPANATVILSESGIAMGVRRVAHQIAEWAGKNSAAPLQIISVLNGARPFTKDLRRELDSLGIPTQLHEIKVATTHGASVTGQARLESGELSPETLRNSTVLVVDDIVDTGATIEFIKEMLKELRPAEVRVAAVINKYAQYSHLSDFMVHNLDIGSAPTYSQNGKLIDHWLFGYGMDLDGKYRDLPNIAWVEVER